MKTLAFFSLLFISGALSAQTISCPKGDCGRFATFIGNAKTAVDGRNFEEAITQYNAAKVCCPAAAKAIDDEILRVFKLIEKEKIKSDENAEIAKREKAKADIALRKANTLISHFYFTQDRAWAYKNGKFAIIDRDGELKSKFIYDRPDTFQTNGYALVFKGKNQLLIDVEGRESPEYETLFPTNKRGYRVENESKYAFADFRGQLLPDMEWYKQIDTFSNGMARVMKDSLWGFIDATGKLKIPAGFSSASSFRDGAAWVEVPKKGWGLIDQKGQFIIEPGYSNAQCMTSDISFATKKGKWGIIDKTGKYIVKPEYDDVGYFEDGMAQVWKDEKIGFVNEKGEEAIPPRYTSVTRFSEGFAIVRADSVTRNFIDKNGKSVFPSLQIEKADNFSEGLAAVKEKGGKYGYIDSTGAYKIEPQFDDAQPFSTEGVAWVKSESRKWKLIDTKGEVITDTTFEKYREFYGGKLAAVKLASGWGFVSSDGKLLPPATFEEVNDFLNGYASVKKDGLWGIIDSTGKIIAKLEYTAVRSFSEGIAAVQKDSKWWFINTGGNLIGPTYSARNPEWFKNGVVWIADEDRNFRLMNRKGELVGDVYYGRRSFNEGMGAAMKRNGKWGFIDTLGNEVIPLVYRTVETFNNGLAYFSTDTTWGYMDKSGKAVFSRSQKTTGLWQSSNYPGEESEGLIAVQDSGKWGFLDLSGKWAIPARYDGINGFEEGYAVVMEGEQNLFIDKKNKTIAQCPVSDISVEELDGKMIRFYDNNYGRFGFLNLNTGKVIGPLSNEDKFCDGVLWVGEHDTKGFYKVGLMDENGEYLIQPKKYGTTRDFEDGVAWVWEDNVWWLIDKKGNKLTTERITSTMGKFSEGWALAYQDGQQVYVDKTGQIVLKIEIEAGDNDDSYAPRPYYYRDEYDYYENEDYSYNYNGYAPSVSRYGDYRAPSFLQTAENSGDFSGGLASVRKSEKWGYIGKTGAFKIPERFDWAGNFSEGLAWVVMGERRKLITPTGDTVRLARSYEGSFPFSGGVAVVVDDEENFGMIDRNGKEIVPLEYEALAYFSEGLAAAKKDGKWGYVNRDGEEVIPPQFDVVYDFKQGKATVKKDDIYFIINIKGQLIVDESLERSDVLDDSDPQSGGG